MIPCARGEGREWKVRADYSPRNREGRGGGGFKRGRGNTLCVYYAGITRVIKGRIINMLEYERCYGGSALFKHL